MTGQNNTNWTEDAQHAMGVLLVRLAKADEDYARAEIARIDLLFARHYGMNPIEAARLRAECERQERTAAPTQDVAQTVKNLLPLELRTAIITALWQVSLADGILRDEEAALVERVAQATGVEPNKIHP